MSQRQARTALGRPRQLLRPWGKAIDSARCRPPYPLQLRTGTVMAHADVVDNAFHLFLPMLKFALSATALVDLMVAVPPTGERPPMRGSRFQVGCLPDPVPEAILSACPDLCGNCPRVEFGIEHVLHIVQVVLAVVTVTEQIPNERDLRDVAVSFSRPVEDIGVLPSRTGIIDPETVVVIPGYEVEIRRADEISRRPAVPRVVEIIV